MAQLSPTTDKLFKLYQRFEPVTLGDGEDAVEVAMWKPTDEEARRGQMFMLERVGFWETEDSKVAERVESFMTNLPDDKDFIISQILEQTIAQKFSESIDLLDPVAVKSLERDMLSGLSIKDFTDLWGVRAGAEDQFEAVHRTKGKEVVRSDLRPYLLKTDEFDQWMNVELARVVEQVFREQETAVYQKEDITTLKAALGTVNRRTVAMGLGVQDWTRQMCAVMTRELTDDNTKGALLFSYNAKSPNYIGHVAPEVMEALSTKMNDLFNTSRARVIREVADNGNFPNSAESQSDSTSLPPVVVVPQTSENTPST